ncbi:DHH family phosphoesterase [Candidatus Woesearchaeota archaeon]|nr:DHH family phosphoesterase [Candidatus Woesearchaeota archaeon]
MDKYKQFYKSIEKAVEKFKSFDKNETIRLVSHLDADGISACAILIHILTEENRKYSISIVQQLDKTKLMELSKEPYSYFIFADLGSGQLNNINELFSKKQVIILDHHEPEKIDKLNSNIIHINPHLFKIDGSNEISGAGVVYLLAENIDKKHEDLSHIAIIGAIGDVQEDNGFLYLNNQILETAVKKGKIKVKKGLRMFGMQTKPLHKVLEYSTDPYIPGVSGSESGAIQFLHQIGIEPKNGNDWKKLIHLNDEEMKKLVAGIIMKRLNETKPEDVLGQIYILPHEEKESPTRDLKEFATLLNACGRMEKASFGMGTCLGIKKDKQKAFQTLLDYKKEIVNAINWFNENKTSSSIIKGKRFIIINAQDNINPNIIGTLASIISKSNDLEEKTYILSLAQTQNKTTKVSLRISGISKEDIDLREILKKIIAKTGGEAGGHIKAAGALIQTEKEQEFIKIAKDTLIKKSMEEKIS